MKFKLRINTCGNARGGEFEKDEERKSDVGRITAALSPVEM
jgi:hypothetical protein